MNSKSRYLGKVIDEDIVISGMSGRFPESDSTDEFAYNLYNGVDMISGENRRWPTGIGTNHKFNIEIKDKIY